jgi:hypothetical protein
MGESGLQGRAPDVDSLIAGKSNNSEVEAVGHDERQEVERAGPIGLVERRRRRLEWLAA